jgi:hypothetical protein
MPSSLCVSELVHLVGRPGYHNFVHLSFSNGLIEWGSDESSSHLWPKGHFCAGYLTPGISAVPLSPNPLRRAYKT